MLLPLIAQGPRRRDQQLLQCATFLASTIEKVVRLTRTRFAAFRNQDRKRGFRSLTRPWGFLLSFDSGGGKGMQQCLTAKR